MAYSVTCLVKWRAVFLCEKVSKDSVGTKCERYNLVSKAPLRSRAVSKLLM